MVEKICKIVLDGLRGVFDQHKELRAKKEQADRVQIEAMCTPGVVAVINSKGERLRDKEKEFLGMASALFYVLYEAVEQGLIPLAEDRKQIAAALQKLNSDFPDNQIRESLRKITLELLN